MIEQDASNQLHQYYNNLQSILKQKLFKKVIKNTKLEGLGRWVERS